MNVNLPATFQNFALCEQSRRQQRNKNNNKETWNNNNTTTLKEVTQGSNSLKICWKHSWGGMSHPSSNPCPTGSPCLCSQHSAWSLQLWSSPVPASCKGGAALVPSSGGWKAADAKPVGPEAQEHWPCCRHKGSNRKEIESKHWKKNTSLLVLVLCWGNKFVDVFAEEVMYPCVWEQSLPFPWNVWRGGKEGPEHSNVLLL